MFPASSILLSAPSAVSTNRRMVPAAGVASAAPLVKSTDGNALSDAFTISGLLFVGEDLVGLGFVGQRFGRGDAVLE